MLWRLLRALGLASKGDGEAARSGPIRVQRSSRTSGVVRDEKTGEERSFEGLEELPPPLRAAVEEALAGRPSEPRSVETTSEEVIRFVDSSGETRVYRSRDELPPEVRALLDRTRPPGSRS